MCERKLETEQNCNILTPTLMAIIAFLSRSPGLLNRRPGGPASLGASFLYRILSPTDWTSCALSYIIVQRPPSSCGRHKSYPFNPSTVKVISDIPRPDAPVIYTDAFPILTAQPGRRSIYNTLNWTYVKVRQRNKVSIDSPKIILSNERLFVFQVKNWS